MLDKMGGPEFVILLIIFGGVFLVGRALWRLGSKPGRK